MQKDMSIIMSDLELYLWGIRIGFPIQYIHLMCLYALLLEHGCYLRGEVNVSANASDCELFHHRIVLFFKPLK